VVDLCLDGAGRNGDAVDLGLKCSGRNSDAVDLGLECTCRNSDVINLRQKRAVEVPIAARLTTRLEIPLSGIRSGGHVSPKALAGFVAVTVLVKILIPVKVWVEAN